MRHTGHAGNREASRGSAGRAARVLLGLWLTAAQAVHAQAWKSPGSEAFEPTVSQKEADLLKQVVTLAADAPGDALALLRKQDMEKASPAMDFAAGNLLLQADDLPAAEKAYEAALKKFPEFRRARVNLGRVYILRNQPARAIELYQSLVQAGQATADALILLGHALVTQENALSAEMAFRQALLLRPGDKDALLGLARCLILQERHREALSLARELCAVDPLRGDLWMLRANASLALDQATNAVVALESARRLGQATPDMLAMLGDLYLNHDQPEDAAARYDEAFAGRSPSIPRMLRAAEGFLLADHDPSAERLLNRAGELARAATEKWPARQQRDFLRLKGDLARLRSDTAGAITIYQQLLQEDPLDGRVLVTLGDLRRQQGSLEEAVMAYERAARIQGYEARSLVRHAQIEVERERYRKAVELLEAAQAFDRQPHVARYLEQVRRLAEFSASRTGSP